MAVDMNFIIPYCPLPPKPPKPLPTKPFIREYHLPQPDPMPSTQSIIPEPPFTHPPPWPPLPFCRYTLSGLDSQIGARASNTPFNEFDAELERLEVVEVIDMNSHSSTDHGDVEPFSTRVAGVIQGSTAPDARPRREASSDRPSHKADRSSPQKITPPLSDSDRDPALDECEPKASGPPPDLAVFSDQRLYSLVKLPRSESRQEQPIAVDLESDGENSPNDGESRRTIGLDMRAGATGGGIVNTSSSPRAKSEPETPADPGKRDGKERQPMERGRVRRAEVRVEIPFPLDALQEREGRGDRSDPSDNSNNSDFNNSSNCSCSDGDDDDGDEAYRESDGDDHVTKRPRKRRRLWTRRSSRSLVTSVACACRGDPSPTAVVNDKPGKRNPTTKHGENPAGDSSSVSAVPRDDAVTNRSGDDIPVSGFLSSYVAGSKVCYTITFCHKETRRLLSANANGLSSPGREARPSVATGIRVPFTSQIQGDSAGAVLHQAEAPHPGANSQVEVEVEAEKRWMPLSENIPTAATRRLPQLCTYPLLTETSPYHG
ncbi:hypothetical protein PAAG_11278 [Paracoccidioides lutzii Pb01]|uniref:Uncharacterized protein n=1 Tax=Paracoccidioides lutzii (strain ATCC MYA-826 / Pb01) TaxID=502779 RepID=A0A0A2V317_PARBA|nr:hypothetical protein PAAG_11278 [Paracoccidioides lutzii Pb01]KGQ01888.1 hypothetical protein PAAG_11278 [Paracoccidioides lutzii Pb01]